MPLFYLGRVPGARVPRRQRPVPRPARPGHLTAGRIGGDGCNPFPAVGRPARSWSASVAGRRRRADHGAVDDDHQDRRRRRHAGPDLRPAGRRRRHRALHVQRAGGGRGPGPHRAPLAGADRRRHPLPRRDGPGRARGRRRTACGSTPATSASPSEIKLVARECKDRGVPIRIGVNAGSLDPRLYKKYGGATPEAMVESAQIELGLFDEVGFDDVKISVKASNVPLMIEAYRQLVRGHRPSAAPRGHRGRAAAGRAHQGHGRHRAPCSPRASATPSATRSPPTRSRRPRPAGSCSRRSACASARTSTSSPARRAAGPRSTSYKVAQEAQAALEAQGDPAPGGGHGLRRQRSGRGPLRRPRHRRRPAPGPPVHPGPDRRGSCPRTRWSSALVEEAEKLVKEGAAARLAAADKNAAAEAEKDRRQLLDGRAWTPTAARPASS